MKLGNRHMESIGVYTGEANVAWLVCPRCVGGRGVAQCLVCHGYGEVHEARGTAYRLGGMSGILDWLESIHV